MQTAILAIGLVLVIEGLAYALAPSLIERMLEAMRQLSTEDRRMMGLAAMAVGVALVAITFDALPQ
ncbi:DUF2065 domain-containing protein [Donghicola eburneus]|uniref:DUF2065 domain-containing protein n=1 Tax=Donghicola eburneus TaxID=393278 RepID=A0A1M4N3C1_9RHOB|nr:DUF2065 domain-containing protein [Donghicola eburneus]SCM68577.1 hypothetical protein KARMA_2800 [Donghicola eburneus]SFQ27584.1 hypothetical protein SAMN05421764_102401 [Donghicola eburneus]